jgi:quinol monooxygenase YgiN
MIVTVAKVKDPDQFLKIFRTVGADKRREHGCRSARVYIDPDDGNRLWSVFDWDEADYAKFLTDPEIPAIARQLGVQEPPVHAVAAIELDA